MESITGARLYELKVDGLEGRFFGGVTRDSDNTSSDHHTNKSKSGKATASLVLGRVLGVQSCRSTAASAR